MAIRLLQVLRRRLPGGAKVRSGLGARRARSGVSGTQDGRNVSRQDAKTAKEEFRNFRIPDLASLASWRESSGSSASHPAEQLILEPAAQSQHLAIAQLDFVVALEQRRKRLDRRDVHRCGFVDARELAIAELFEQVLQRTTQD